MFTRQEHWIFLEKLMIYMCIICIFLILIFLKYCIMHFMPLSVGCWEQLCVCIWIRVQMKIILYRNQNGKNLWNIQSNSEWMTAQQKFTRAEDKNTGCLDTHKEANLWQYQERYLYWIDYFLFLLYVIDIFIAF